MTVMVVNANYDPDADAHSRSTASRKRTSIQATQPDGKQGRKRTDHFRSADPKKQTSFYAIDLTLPVVPLRQESKYDICYGDAFEGWRWAKFIYSFLGKLVAAPALLTLSGVIRV